MKKDELIAEIKVRLFSHAPLSCNVTQHATVLYFPQMRQCFVAVASIIFKARLEVFLKNNNTVCLISYKV